MTDAKVEFRRFHHVTIAVDDLDAAVNDWTERLRWPPATRSSQVPPSRWTTRTSNWFRSVSAPQASGRCLWWWTTSEKPPLT